MRGKKITIIFCAFAALLVAGFLIWDVPRGKVEILLERSAIQKAAMTYLKAEKEGDLKQAYALLAPSSVYKKTHSYEEFLKDIANYPSVKINTYKIVDIYCLRDNDNRDNYPGVDKFVQVEVDVTFANSGENSIFNYCFTFLKEKGSWYKG
ncbi:MAG TPA: hypothetical protein P5347_03835 [Smithellaceae bacterium]|nr:hypothetical protein [Smithellaceae bacterium]